MTMSDYREAIERASVETGPASPRFVQWARRHGVPESAIARFASAWVRDDDAAVGAVMLMTEERIMDTDAQEPWWLTAGFLAIGSCFNGDPVVLDLSQDPPPVCFVSHEEMGDPPEPRRFAATAASDLDDLLRRAQDIDSFPVDYNEVQTQNGGKPGSRAARTPSGDRG